MWLFLTSGFGKTIPAPGKIIHTWMTGGSTRWLNVSWTRCYSRPRIWTLCPVYSMLMSCCDSRWWWHKEDPPVNISYGFFLDGLARWSEGSKRSEWNYILRQEWRIVIPPSRIPDLLVEVFLAIGETCGSDSCVSGRWCMKRSEMEQINHEAHTLHTWSSHRTWWLDPTLIPCVRNSWSCGR